MEFRFCIQDPSYDETTYLHEAVVQAAVGAISWRGVYAFVSQDGVNHLVEDPIFTEFVQTGGEIDLIVGLDAVTNRSALERLQEITAHNQNFRARVFWNRSAALFHPKLSEFNYPDGRRTLIVGSGNLTPGGLRTNYEGYAIINSQHGDVIDVSALDEFFDRHDDEIRAIDSRALERAAQNIIRPIGRARQPGSIIVRPLQQRRAAVPALRIPQPMIADRILVAQVPKAGGRWAQVHFNIDVVRDYFRVTDYRSQRLYLTQVAESGVREDVEVRPCIYSDSNKNHKIEIGAARGKEYPESQPILVFRLRQLRVFDYMLRLPGDDGYASLKDLTRRLPSVGRGFPRVITNVNTLKDAWNNCPLVAMDDNELQDM